MALTVKDILTLPSLKNFELIAGKKGLDNYVITAGIADYEFAEDLNYDLSKAFEKDSIVISSLLFAKDNPNLLLPAIKILKESGVSAFAYKRILYDTLPDEVIRYAEENDFPLFSFKDEAWFENIIFDVMAAVERDDSRHLSESNIEKMIKGTVHQDEVDKIRRDVSLLLDKTISVAYIKTPDLDATRVFRSFYISKHLREKLLVSKYNEGVFLLITTSKWNEQSHRIILEEACQVLSLPVNHEDVALSKLHHAMELDKAFREGYYAWLANILFLRKRTSYDDLGVYTSILPLANFPELKIFSKTYLAKLIGYEETIASYVKNGGDVVATSIDLSCHSNTVRYRINKIKDLVNTPNATDYELFRDLSIAYIIAKLLEN